jgi:hypothetical protein
MSDMRELLDRARRIETRLTKFMEANGFDTQTQKPVWDLGRVTMPSMDCSLKHILDSVPVEYEGEVVVVGPGGNAVCYLYIGDY